jgi:hypothetical protein
MVDYVNVIYHRAVRVIKRSSSAKTTTKRLKGRIPRRDTQPSQSHMTKPEEQAFVKCIRDL